MPCVHVDVVTNPLVLGEFWKLEVSVLKLLETGDIGSQTFGSLQWW